MTQPVTSHIRTMNLYTLQTLFTMHCCTCR